jgi:hypothetical protein
MRKYYRPRNTMLLECDVTINWSEIFVMPLAYATSVSPTVNGLLREAARCTASHAKPVAAVGMVQV